MQGWDLTPSCISITTPRLLIRRMVTILAQGPYISHQGGVLLHWFKNFTAAWPFQHLITSIMNMVGEGWDWYLGSKMITTTCFRSRVGLKLAWPVFHFWHQDWVTADLFGQFTASQPFQCLNVSIMNGFAMLRFEFIIQGHHHTPAFELGVATR